MKLKLVISIIILTLGFTSYSMASTVASTVAAEKIQSAISSICNDQGSNDVVVAFPNQGLLNNNKLYMAVKCSNNKPLEWVIGARPNYSMGSNSEINIRLNW